MYIEIKETFLELPSEIQFSEAANAAILTQDKWGDVWQTLKTDADLNYTDAGEPVSLASRVTTATSAIYHAITELDHVRRLQRRERLPLATAPVPHGPDPCRTERVERQPAPLHSDLQHPD